MGGQCGKSSSARSEINREIRYEITCDATPRKGRLSVAEREREEAQAFAEARRQHPAVESAINNLEHRGLDRVRSHGADGFAHTPLHCRYWPPTCTASACLCGGACERPNDVEDAALPDCGYHLRISTPPARHTETGTAFGARKSGMWAGLTPNAVQWCRCGGFRGRNLAESVAVRRRFRAGVRVFCQTLPTEWKKILPKPSRD